MKKPLKNIKFLPSFLILLFGILLILNPIVCRENVAKAIIICGQVLIPSLFPFGVCVLFILKSDAITPINPSFLIFLFSLLGGNPMGANLLNEEVLSKRLDRENAEKMLHSCVNAGPAFIVSAVGAGVLNSQKIGYVLLVSHILASLVICLISSPIRQNKTEKREYISPIDNFVVSAAESAKAVISICGFVILFSVLTGYLEYYGNRFPILIPLIYLTEITVAVTKTRNIVLISFLLGFSGFCIWAQVLSVGKDIKINIMKFAFFRLIHGTLSAVFTYITLKIIPLEIPVFSNGVNFSFKPFVSSAALGISLLVLGIVFIISLSKDRENRKILEEFI